MNSFYKVSTATGSAFAPPYAGFSGKCLSYRVLCCDFATQTALSCFYLLINFGK